MLHALAAGRSVFLSAIAFSCALMLGLAPCAQAQTRDAVVVTATRFSDVLRDLPIGVSLISADDIRRSAASNLPEILSQFGLLHIRDTAGTPNAQVDLRGFGITGDQNTLILVDGVRLSENEQVPAQLSSIPLESIERIEILRGSGSVLYGGGTSGGTINIITRTPLAGETRGHLLARAGGFGTRELRAGFSRQGERIGASIAFSDEDTKGYRRNNQFNQVNASAALEARGERARGFLRFGLEDQKLRLAGALTEAQMQADRRQTLTPNDWSDRTGAHALLGASLELGRHEAAAELSYRDKHARAFFAPAFFVDTEARQHAFTPRAKLVFDAWRRTHEVTLGIDWQQWNYTSRSAASAATLGAPFSHREGEQENRALYAQANVALASSTRAVLGARLQRTHERLTENVFPANERRAARDLRSHEAALRHNFAGGWSAYAKYARSFRLANFDDNACFFPPCAATLLEPQTANALEVGGDVQRGAWQARAALYQMQLRNEIYFSPLTFSNVNLAPTRRRGLELEAQWHATSALDLRAGLALQQARFRSGVYGGVDVSGKEVPLVPEALATAGLSWRFASRTRLNANLRYVGEQRYDNDQANTFSRKQPDYTVLDLKLEHRVGRAELALEVKNLANTRYYSYGVWNFANSFSAFPAPERALYASAALRFD